jgi:hypothetical protein
MWKAVEGLHLYFVLWRHLTIRSIRRMKFGTVNVMDIPTSFIYITLFFYGGLNMETVQILWLCWDKH